MADTKIIDLPALATQDGTDIYEVSKNGTGSFRESRTQMEAKIQQNFVVQNWDGTPTPISVTSGTGIDITGGVISTTGDQNIEYQDVYDNTVATSADANTDMTNGFPFTLSSTSEVSRPIPSMSLAQGNLLVNPINAGHYWREDDDRLCANRGTPATPVWDCSLYESDLASLVSDAAYGESFFQANATETVISVISDPVKVNGTYNSGEISGFTQVGGTLTYTNLETRAFQIGVSLTTTLNLSNANVLVSIFINGSPVPKSQQSVFLGGTSPGEHSVSVQATAELSVSDTIEVFVQNDTNTDNITIQDINFSAISIGGIGSGSGSQVVISWNGLTTPVNVVPGTNIDITAGVISTPAEVNVVQAWDGSAVPLSVTAGTDISISAGVISYVGTSGDNVVTSWDGSATPVAVTSTGLMDITGGVISTSAEANVVSLWAGAATPVNVTAGADISITAGAIAYTGSGEANVVTSWNGSASPVAITAGTGIDIAGGVITNTGGAGGGDVTILGTSTAFVTGYVNGVWTPVWNSLQGTDTVAANTFAIGSTVKLETTGIFNAVTTGGTGQLRVSFGSLITNVTSSTLDFLGAGFTGQYTFHFIYSITRLDANTITATVSGFYKAKDSSIRSYDIIINPGSIAYDPNVANTIVLEYNAAVGAGNTCDFIAQNLNIIQYK